VDLDDPASGEPSPDIAAAVPYRVKEHEVNIFLVETKGGGKWTFPKGHIRTKKRESSSQAAAREAKEEGGVLGEVEEEPLTYYRYSKGPGHEYLVAAHLLKVEHETKPARSERKRDRGWFTKNDAQQRLKEGGREEEYATEHERVIAAALKRLDRQ
jgi:ADP-ribose pyrophosphatase YjhB (NUDIX family)